MYTINSIKAQKAQWFSCLIFFCTLFILITASACSSPEEDKQEKSEQNLAKTTVPIEGMTCNACVASIKNELKSLDASEGVEVSLQHRNATVFYKEGTITPRQIQDAINGIGYKAGEPLTEGNKQ
jgi:copper chaperone CopZ